jgi:hypothetical protein
LNTASELAKGVFALSSWPLSIAFMEGQNVIGLIIVLVSFAFLFVEIPTHALLSAKETEPERYFLRWQFSAWKPTYIWFFVTLVLLAIGIWRAGYNLPFVYFQF